MAGAYDRLPLGALRVFEAVATCMSFSGLLAAAEEGLGFALARWTLATHSLQKGTLQLAAKEALPFGSAYYFVCPKAFLGIPKVVQFREWIFAEARAFRPPESER